jgi:hypothetical protein
MVKSNQSNALWPYLAILILLFVLSLAAPRTWNRTDSTSTPAPVARVEQPATVLPAQHQQESQVLAPRTPEMASKVTEQVKLPNSEVASLIPVVVPPAIPSDLEYPRRDRTQPQLDQELLNQLAAAKERMLSSGNSLLEQANQASSGVASIILPVKQSLQPEEIARWVAGHARQARLQQFPRELSAGQQALQAIVTPQVVDLQEAATELQELWPVAESLIAGCESFRANPTTQAWANQTVALLTALSKKKLYDPASQELLGELQKQVQAAGELANQNASNSITVTQLRRQEYNLTRRLEIWNHIATRASNEGALSRCIQPLNGVDQELLAAVQLAKQFLSKAPVAAQWEEYLSLNQVQELAAQQTLQLAERSAVERASHGFTPAPTDLAATQLLQARRELSAAILDRVQAKRLTEEQRQLLNQPELKHYLMAVKAWSIQPRLLVDLAQSIENYEATRLPSDATLLNRFYQELTLSADQRDHALAATISKHYRNANARLSINQDLLNRMMPPQEPRSENVNEEISGVPTWGHSTSFQTVKLRLIPHASAWNFSFDITGLVESRTTSNAGPVTLVNQGQSQYQAEKLVLVRADGIRARPAKSLVDNKTDLASLDTNYDGIPLVSTLVRNYALQEYYDNKPNTQQIIGQRVAQKTSARIDSEVNQRLYQMQQRVENKIVQPLRQFQLDPELIQLQTTDERAIARTRLANDQQLGGHTSRPLAMSDALSSLQLHESLINNFLTNLELDGQKITIRDLQKHLGQKFKRAPQELPADVPDDLVFSFAASDALVVTLEDNRLKFVMALDELQHGNKRWQNLLVTVNFRIETDGLQLRLTRDGTVSLGGDQAGKVDVALRGIWARIFPKEKTTPLIPDSVLTDKRLAGMVWSQVDIQNGWLALAMTDQKRLAARPVETTK